MKNPTQEVAAQRKESKAQIIPVQVRLDAILEQAIQWQPNVIVPKVGTKTCGHQTLPGNPRFFKKDVATSSNKSSV